MERPQIPDSSSLSAFAALLEFAPQERAGSDAMIVVAHPDDETIGIGGHLSSLNDTTILHVTDGAPRDLADARKHGFANCRDYADARRSELIMAMSEAGIGADQLVGLGISDQEPAHNMMPLALQLAGFFRDRKPRFVLTHPFEGGHPDHDATAFSVAAACRLMRHAGAVPPVVIEMASYHAGAHGPVYQDFLDDTVAPVIARSLAGPALERKRRMLACFLTQRRILAPFKSPIERFRTAPRYDFCSLPNGGRLLYEQLRLGLTGPQWLVLARQTADQLELAEI
jgi:N-acetylglucosamine malate deacetylase 2